MSLKKGPRLDPYLRLITRLYEAIFLLQRLGPPTRPHTIVNHDPLNGLATQQRFLKTLAFMVDCRKGGDTTAAIAVEETDDDFNFVVAVNEQRQKETAKVVLKTYLHQLARILALPPDKHHEKGDTILLKRLVSFSTMRLKKEVKLLESTAKKCVLYLQNFQSSSVEKLISFLRPFGADTSENLILTCQMAYSAEKDPMLDKARHLGRDPEDGSNPPDDVVNFKKLVHYVHRIAAHFRSVKRLIDDGARLKPLLERYQVTAVSSRPPCPRPEADNLMTMNGVLKRILPAEDERHEGLAKQLQQMNEQTGLEAWIQDRFAPEETDKGSIHCEVQLLEHFYQNKLRFAKDDPYIGCSKPSCLCCELYFRNHPLQCAQLDTHGRVYPNWAPPLLANGRRDAAWSVQRRVLGEVAHGLGDLVISRLERLGIAARNGALFDSLDGHTVSGVGFVEITDDTDSDESESSDSDESGGAPL
ncbi:deaminase-like protein [Microdochium nivale]|nr:deaminase-like protein [Microdochium nivale]